MKYAMLIDQTKCIGCGACTVECKAKYEASFGVLRTEMKKYESGSFPNVKLRYKKHACMHCFVAACEEICPVDAIWHVEGENGGMVEIDKETCIGCGACVTACPFDVPVLDPEDDNNSEKCSFCAFRVVEGRSTYCAEACPVGAILFGEREDLIAAGESRVSDLQAAGHDKAHLYGKDDTGVLILIDEDYDVYDLVPEGFTLSSIGWRALGSYGSLAVAAAIGGIGYRVVKNRLDEISREKEEETKT